METGELEFIPSPDAAYGRGVGHWHRRPSGVLEGRMRLYMYSAQHMPDNPTDVLVLGVEPDAAGRLTCCLFSVDGEREQIGACCASALPLPPPPTPPPLSRSP